VDPVPDTLLLRKSDSAGNRTRDLWVSSQELWPLDHREHLKKTAHYVHWSRDTNYSYWIYMKHAISRNEHVIELFRDMGRDGTVGIAICYRFDDQVVGVWVPGNSSPGDNGVKLTTHIQLPPKSRKRRSIHPVSHLSTGAML
jgi:hypothetical protein